MVNVAIHIDKDVSRNTTFATYSTFYQYYHIYKNDPISTVYISENSKPARLFISFLDDPNIIEHFRPLQ